MSYVVKSYAVRAMLLKVCYVVRAVLLELGC